MGHAPRLDVLPGHCLPSDSQPTLASPLSFLLLTADSIVDLDALSAHRSAEWALFV